MIKRKLLQPRGFTLVEILVMISVVTILSSIIYAGYTAYQRNAYKTQIYSTVDSYEKSLKAYSLEKRSYPTLSSCLPHNSTCCTSEVNTPSTVYCGTNQDSGGSHNIDTTPKTGTEISKYIHGQVPKLPTFTTFTNCVTGLSSNGPCKASAAVPNVGVAYVSNVLGSKYTSNESSLTRKGFLIYYVSTSYECGSDSVMTLSGTNLVFNSSATYTRQTSTYRECIIGLRN